MAATTRAGITATTRAGIGNESHVDSDYTMLIFAANGWIGDKINNIIIE